MKELQKGQTIIEAIVALSIILLILAAISIVIVNGLYNSRYIKNQNLANKYAQQGMEFVRNIAKNNLANFGSTYTNGTWCIDPTTNLLTQLNCTGVNIPGTSFQRQIIFTSTGLQTQCASNETQVQVVVSWKSSKCTNGTFCHSSNLISCMPNSYPLSQP